MTQAPTQPANVENMTFEDMLGMEDNDVSDLLDTYTVYKEERKRFQESALIQLPANPPMVLDCIHFIRVNNGLKAEGIFRVNGDSHVVDTIRESFVHDVDLQDILLSIQQSMNLKNYDIATALKSYFRLLKDPLMPIRLYEEMKAAMQHDEAPVDEFNKLIESMQEPNKAIFAFTMMFFQDIIEKSAFNKMGPSNLATCLTMSIVRFQDQGTQHFAAMREIGVSTKIIVFMLLNIDFTAFITPARYLEFLRSTSYKVELLPRDMEEFKDHEQYSRFKGNNLGKINNHAEIETAPPPVKARGAVNKPGRI